MSCNVMVIGANRGLGFALTKRMINTTPCNIIAGVRDPSKARESMTASLGSGMDRIMMLPIDVTNEETIEKAANVASSSLGSEPLRLLLHCPGILHAEKSIKQCHYEDVLETYKVNAMGPLFVAKHFYSLVAGGQPTKGLPDVGVFATISARTGSIADNELGGWYSYRSSKAALNQSIRSLAHELKYRKMDSIAVALHPGTVKTDLSREFQKNVKPEKLFSPDQSAGYLLEVIEKLKHADNGGFFAYDGNRIPY
ncbi:hypothetical protein BZG36_03248 [Bifiguratus adelaidae]|uniref:Uncharacterized protein n=1 Tax=Bifiguratus adelaidae TaxID=1938954 RepID=A0A261Y060_9FUNG|nr:hypothetical protein BZG36_03248 [Bifiguratus adelaidae]